MIRIITMSQKGLLALVLELRDIFCVIFYPYEGWK